MRRRAALAAAWLGLALPALAAAEQQDPACGVTPMVAVSGAVTYRLPHTFVRAGTDSVWTHAGPWLRGRDYLIDLLRGEVRVLRAPAPGETLWVAACWLLDPPPLEFAPQRYRPLPPPGAKAPADSGGVLPAARPSTGRELGSAPNGAQLNVTGNKTIAVEFGSSQDAALRQSLDLAVTGQLAPGVELAGVLSDRNTPLTAQGSSQDLQSLDRVLLELKAPRGSASFGDIPLTLDRGQFARLERRVQGVSGEWRQGDFVGSVAAASAQGEYNRMQFLGVDGLQGPYGLTARDGDPAITVVAGSEIVSVDGVRMTRGESADYSIDYERARITFSNRRPITSASRITVEYQFAVTQYRRNIASFSGAYHHSGVSLFMNALSESDDRGQPLDLTFTPDDRLILAAAGDSASRALAAGVTAGIGDYDSVRVARDSLIYAFVAPDSGHFIVSFARIGTGLGDYADSAEVAGHTVYHWVGPGRGDFRVGRALPLPQSHRLVSAGGSVTLGAATIEAEGAMSKLDLNTFSPIDDQNHSGGAGRAALTVEGAPGTVPGRIGAQLGTRAVSRRFQSFSELERPFAEEDWGLPVGADLEHQRRSDAAAWWQPRPGSELRLDASRLVTPDGYAGWRRHAEWTGAQRLATHLLWLQSDGTLAGREFTDAGRTHWLGETHYTGRWAVPSLRFEHDLRRTPSDSAAVRDRSDELAADLAAGDKLPWRLAGGWTERRELHVAAGTDQALHSSAFRLQAESPAASALGLALNAQRRIVRDPLGANRTTSDLASMRLRADRKRWGLTSNLGVEITNEAQNRTVRTLTFVGQGRGGYDQFGNFVGTGDYDLVLAVSPLLDRYARVATSGHVTWAWGKSQVWRGSKLDFSLEDEARRLGALKPGDVLLSTGLALVDPGLSHGSVLQRLQGDVAPGSRVAALRLLAERRVTADRTVADFTQTNDQRDGSLRWRTQPGKTASVETEAHLNWQRATEDVTGGAGYARTLIDQGAQTQFIYQPGARLRAAAAADLSWSRPADQPLSTRTLKLGPDLGLSIGQRGRAELSLRRAFLSGPPPTSLLPSADPAGAARWDGTARFDLRLHETTTFGINGEVQERPDRPTLVTGRAEVRAFF